MQKQIHPIFHNQSSTKTKIKTNKFRCNSNIKPNNPNTRQPTRKYISRINNKLQQRTILTTTHKPTKPPTKRKYPTTSTRTRRHSKEYKPTISLSKSFCILPIRSIWQSRITNQLPDNTKLRNRQISYSPTLEITTLTNHNPLNQCRHGKTPISNKSGTCKILVPTNNSIQGYTKPYLPNPTCTKPHADTKRRPIKLTQLRSVEHKPTVTLYHQLHIISCITKQVLVLSYTFLLYILTHYKGPDSPTRQISNQIPQLPPIIFQPALLIIRPINVTYTIRKLNRAEKNFRTGLGG